MIVEFLDEVSIDACNKYSNMDMRVAPSLFLEFSGSPKSLDDNAEIVGRDRALVQFSVPFELARVVNTNCVIWYTCFQYIVISF